MNQGSGGGGVGVGTQTELMVRSAQHVQAVQQSITAQLAGLRQRLVDMPGLWVGPAGAGFVSLMARWDRDAQSLANALEAIGDQIRTSGGIYQENENVQVQAVQRLGGSISQAL